mmetsp:Transcript_70134/g.111566  ORF Transcript_70134/g.111566 Transcript_70134/m.111566 type:complete len:496 (-) Transcript_70134:134-1621(-)
MGTVLQTCTGGDESKRKLEKVEAENEQLRRELIESQDAYRKLQEDRHHKVKEKEKLYKGGMKVTQELMKERSEKQRLADRYNKQFKRLSTTQEENQKLQMENAMLKEKLANEVIAEEDEPDDEPFGGTAISSTTSTRSNTLRQGTLRGATPGVDDEDEEISPRNDIVKIRNWLVYKNLNEKDLTSHLATLLSRRNESHRSKIPEAYVQKYGAQLMDDIGKTVKKGHVFDLIDGLLKTRAEFDAVCIKEMITNRVGKLAAFEVAEILCCRNVEQLQLICHAYKKLHGADLKDKIYKLHPGKTFQAMINHLFTFQRNINETSNKIKIDAKIHGDVEFLMDKNIKWKNADKKLQLINMVMSNPKQYVYGLAQHYFQQSQINLTDFLLDKIGEKSVTGTWARTRVEYCLDPADFYARRIQLKVDDGLFKPHNVKEVNRILLSTFDTELMSIQETFNQLNYGNSKSMIIWFNKACKSEKHAFFVTRLLENCGQIPDSLLQ